MPASSSRSGVKKPTLVDKLEAWSRAYDGIMDHWRSALRDSPLLNGLEEIDTTAMIAASITAASSIVAGLDWNA